MSKIGFLVVNQRTGNVAEGKDHAAKIFDTLQAARSECRPLSTEQPVPITYSALAQSLLQGTAFCFVTEEGHARFLKAVRNDPVNRPLIEYSQDKSFIRWRHSNAKPQSQAGTGAGMASNAAV